MSSVVCWLFIWNLLCSRDGQECQKITLLYCDEQGRFALVSSQRTGMPQEIRLAELKRTRHILSSTNPTAGTTLLYKPIICLARGSNRLGKQNSLVKLKAKVKRLKQLGKKIEKKF